MFARSKVWVGLFAAVVGSNHAGDIVICLLLVFRNVLFWVIMQQAAVVRNYHYSLRKITLKRAVLKQIEGVQKNQFLQLIS